MATVLTRPAPVGANPSSSDPRPEHVRDVFVDAVRAVGTLCVVALHWLMADATWDGRSLHVGNALGHGAGWVVTWVLQVLPLPYAVLLVIVFVAPFIIILARIDYSRPLRIALGLLPLALIVIGLRAAPEAFATGFQSLAHEIVTYSDGKSVESNGRLAMLLYREAQRAGALEKIGPYRDRAAFERGFEEEVAALRPQLRPRDVHLIVLESFLDPRLFRNVKFSRDPAHPDFERLFGDALGFSLSPVFGGGTAQAEFEVLCGVPAFERLSSVEFNAFTGAPAHCLPGLLSALGYRSVASNSYKPNFFNAQPAYQGIGFAEQQFPAEFYSAGPTYLHAGDPGVEDYMFDGDLFAQNLAFVADHLRRNAGRPCLL